ncbi:MAG TPA: dTDP-4-dehydrorhamnose 3,5-epimerase family protein [Candidatus Saccharimonadales bacterium]|nr:dTDP-4-dehydrorhamnose 3,5-epimerase family protein [Candidatus Saccharimonadales bacterium]
MAVATTEYTGHETEIPGLLIFDVTSIGDERGWFQEKFHKQKLVEAGLPEDFQVVQNNVAYNKDSGVARGFHAEPWDKYISVASGRVFVAYVDLRQGESFGKVVTLEVDKNKAVFIPKGVGNSYQTLTEDVYYIYSVNDHWSADSYGAYPAVNMADPNIGVDWPISMDQATISDRDRNLPNLSEIKPIEV